MSDIATEAWCDDCHGYTHMPYCPAYVEPTSNKHKGDVIERRETIAERLRQRAATIRAAGNDSGSVKDQNFIDGGISALEVLASDVEDGAFAWSNEHTALVEQRDRLLRLLRPVTSPTACYCAVMKDEKCWHCEARELIATVEQVS